MPAKCTVHTFIASVVTLTMSLLHLPTLFFFLSGSTWIKDSHFLQFSLKRENRRCQTQVNFEATFISSLIKKGYPVCGKLCPSIWVFALLHGQPQVTSSLPLFPFVCRAAAPPSSSRGLSSPPLKWSLPSHSSYSFIRLSRLLSARVTSVRKSRTPGTTCPFSILTPK